MGQNVSGDWSFGKFFDQNIHWFGRSHEFIFKDDICAFDKVHKYILRRPQHFAKSSPYFCTVVKSKVKISQNFGAFSEYMNFTGQFLEKQLCNLTPSMLSHSKLVRKGQNCPPILKFDNYLPIIEKIREILNLTFPPLLSHFASFCLRQNTYVEKS